MAENKMDSSSGPALPAGPELVEVEAVHAVKHGGVYFEPGDVLELPLAVAEGLLTLGVVRLAMAEDLEDQIPPELP